MNYKETLKEIRKLVAGILIMTVWPLFSVPALVIIALMASDGHTTRALMSLALFVPGTLLVSYYWYIDDSQ